MRQFNSLALQATDKVLDPTELGFTDNGAKLLKGNKQLEVISREDASIVALHIDTSARFQIEINTGAESLSGFTFKLVDNSSHSSKTEQGLHRHMVDNLQVQVDESSNRIRVTLHGEPLADLTLDKNTGELQVDGKMRQLGTFDLRQFSQQGSVYAGEWIEKDPRRIKTYRPLLDLHTHFGGQMSARSLIDTATKNDTSYPLALLKKIGNEQLITLAEQSLIEGSDSLVSMGRLGTALNKPENLHTRQILEDSLRVAPGEVVPFTEMEAIYQRRTPLVKDLESFGDHLRSIAEGYQQQGIKYAELSVSDVIKPEWLAEAHRVLPEIEQQTGVRLTFLVGVWRHNLPEYNMDQINIVSKLARQSPYIVGVDFMGHETNTTRAFEDQIKAAAAIREEVPHFQVRVHGGENAIFPENVRLAIEAGATRIGHGLYGVDDEVLKLAREKDVIIEFNPDSNRALNNIDANGAIDATEELPMERYLEAGARITLSSDGSGLYQSGGMEEVRVGVHIGLRSEHFVKIGRSDVQYMRKMEDSIGIALGAEVAFPADFPESNFDHSLWRRKELERLEQRQSLTADLEAKGIKVMQGEDLEHLLSATTPVLFSGASRSSWPKISEENQQNVTAFVDTLLDKLDPQKVTLVTGGTNYGFEKLVHERAQARGFTVLGSVVEGSSADEYDSGTITHAMFSGQSWYDKSGVVIDMIRKHNGIIIFAGGGDILNDEIQAASNVNAKMFLMDGPEGASTNKARNFKVSEPEKVFTDFESFQNTVQGAGFTSIFR